MVIRIFYCIIAVFSIVMVFVVFQDPYFSDEIKQDVRVANMQVNDVVDYEINASVVSGIYEADEIVRYSNQDEFLHFKANVLRGNLKHDISSQKAIMRDDNITFKDSVKYDNNESLNFSSDEVIYNTKSKIAISKVPFIAIQNGDKIIGKSLRYDMVKKQTDIKGFKAWIEQERH
ncbi:LPS export ABC transporter periplasmic protein LptC [Campylobacter sp. faydin G-140]|uniref:LPS export ABC transporter periplasmic protein LptC n=1 Tax=Campylobacter anatolicus TaxID=2829105 RepID=UPI001B951D1F|nr:LPS export ABC transporter periplasmic protein LptC [Campylobacter anatolicus]MBR8465663.1 LPS export ABC transporter periplasmic protein LptC [Campylobacter anatolicus]